MVDASLLRRYVFVLVLLLEDSMFLFCVDIEVFVCFNYCL